MGPDGSGVDCATYMRPAQAQVHVHEHPMRGKQGMSKLLTDIIRLNWRRRMKMDVAEAEENTGAGFLTAYEYDGQCHSSDACLQEPPHRLVPI